VIAQSGNSHLIYGSLTAGGILGAILTEQFIAPSRANKGLGALDVKGSRDVGRTNGIDVRFAPQSVLLAGMGMKGYHSILSLTF